MSDRIYNTIIAANHLYFCPTGGYVTGGSNVIGRNVKPAAGQWVKVGIVDGFDPNNELEKTEITAPINFINQTVREVSHTLKMQYDVALKSVDNFVMAAIFKCDFTENESGLVTFAPGSKASHEGWFKWMQVDPGDGENPNKDADGNVILTILDVYGSYTVDGYSPKNTEGATPTLHITQLYSTKNKGLFNRNGIYIAAVNNG
jgi:hypothetical protein